VALGYLASPRNARARIALRINGLDKAAGVADVNALLHRRTWPDFLVLPKTETSGHLQILDRLLAAAGANTHLIGIVESAAGLAAVEAISAATPRLAGLMLGAADLAADLGADAAWEPLAFARSRLVAASALHAVMPIDSPFFDIHDERGLREETGRAVALGFEAKAAIHPNQIAIINAALTPTEAAVAKARAIIAENILPAYKTVSERRYRETNGLYYEDFEPGDVFEHRPGRTVLDVDNTYFTLLTLNIQPVHFDAAYAAKTEWKKPLVDSTFTLALLTGMSVRTVCAKVVANLGWDKVKATHPVFAGDTLYAESTVLHKRESKSRPTQGIVTVSTRGVNQDGKEVMTFERTMLIYRRGHSPEEAANY
jgi:itaconyl-CoA hydratase